MEVEYSDLNETDSTLTVTIHMVSTELGADEFPFGDGDPSYGEKIYFNVSHDKVDSIIKAYKEERKAKYNKLSEHQEIENFIEGE